MYKNLRLSNANSWTRDTAESTTKNTLEHLKTYLDDLPNQPKYLGYFKRSAHWVRLFGSIE